MKKAQFYERYGMVQPCMVLKLFILTHENIL